MSSFYSNHIMSQLKISEKLCAMSLKGDEKSKEKLTPRLKNDIGNLVNFNKSSRKSENYTRMC